MLTSSDSRSYCSKCGDIGHDASTCPALSVFGDQKQSFREAAEHVLLGFFATTGVIAWAYIIFEVI